MTKQFLSCDWGTSSFRLRLIDADNGRIISKIEDGEGIAAVYNLWQKSGLSPDERVSFYRKIVVEKIKQLEVQPGKSTAVLISGMASSSIGMMELPYADLPLKMDGDNVIVKQIDLPGQDEGYNIFLISGASSKKDVMRGEETILLGCDLGSPAKQIAILPGTHSKHAFISSNGMYDIKSYMTGEFFELLSSKSILSGSVSKPKDDFFNEEYFRQGVQEGMEGNLLNVVFRVRIRQLLNSVSPEENYYYLSGLLIGAELKGITKENTIHLVCGEKLLPAYRSAISLIHGKNNLLYTDADKALVAGHCKLAKRLL